MWAAARRLIITHHSLGTTLTPTLTLICDGYQRRGIIIILRDRYVMVMMMMMMMTAGHAACYN
jgi:hypothetical protein